MSNYSVEYRPEVNDDLDRIPKNIQLRIKNAIEQRLVTIPNRYGERLKRSLLGLWKLRIGDYRVVYEIKKESVKVWIIAHRKDVYAKTQKRWLKG